MIDSKQTFTIVGFNRLLSDSFSFTARQLYLKTPRKTCLPNVPPLPVVQRPGSHLVALTGSKAWYNPRRIHGTNGIFTYMNMYFYYIQVGKDYRSSHGSYMGYENHVLFGGKFHLMPSCYRVSCWIWGSQAWHHPCNKRQIKRKDSAKKRPCTSNIIKCNSTKVSLEKNKGLLKIYHSLRAEGNKITLQLCSIYGCFQK